MSGTMFRSNPLLLPSNPCYLPIYCEGEVPGSIRWSAIWTNFAEHNSNDITPLADIIQEYNGILIKDVVVFNTEQDKVWFILRWS